MENSDHRGLHIVDTEIDRSEDYIPGGLHCTRDKGSTFSRVSCDFISFSGQSMYVEILQKTLHMYSTSSLKSRESTTIYCTVSVRVPSHLLRCDFSLLFISHPY